LWSVAHLATGSSAEVAYFSADALRNRIRDRAKSAPFHLVYVASTSMIPYALELAPRVPVVLDFGDVDSEWWRDRARQFSGFKTKIYRAEAMRLREVEIMGARRATHCLVATPQAARTVASFAPWAAVSVIGDGVTADEPAVPTRIGGPHLIAITTREGLDGLPIKHGRELYLEDNVLGFAERLIDLLRKPTLREVMGSRGRAFVRAHCSTGAEGARFSQVIAAAMNGTSRNGSAPDGNGAGVIA